MDIMDIDESSVEGDDTESDMLPSVPSPAPHGQEYPQFQDKDTQTEFCPFELPQFLHNEEALNSFTGINNDVLKTLTVCASNVAQLNNETIDKLQFRIVIVLCKLKLNISMSCLAVLFGISKTSCSRTFYSTLSLLAVSVKPAIYWPTKGEFLKNMPKCFFKFRNTRVVLDCTEVHVQKLKCLNCRIKSYTHYKRAHTMKFLIGITPSGLISYVSPAYGGRTSDKSIFNREKVIQLLDPNDGVMVDKGVLIDKECEENFVKLIRPPFLRKQFSEEDANTTAAIARARVHVERSIQRVKNFKILREQIDWYMIPYVNDIMTVVAAIVNLSAPILADDKF